MKVGLGFSYSFSGETSAFSDVQAFSLLTFRGSDIVYVAEKFNDSEIPFFSGLQPLLAVGWAE